jgi:hypothetical protein
MGRGASHFRSLSLQSGSGAPAHTASAGNHTEQNPGGSGLLSGFLGAFLQQADVALPLPVVHGHLTHTGAVPLAPQGHRSMPALANWEGSPRQRCAFRCDGNLGLRSRRVYHFQEKRESRVLWVYWILSVRRRGGFQLKSEDYRGGRIVNSENGSVRLGAVHSAHIQLANGRKFQQLRWFRPPFSHSPHQDPN